MVSKLAWAPLVAAASASIIRRDCDDVHLFLARGNNEPYPGRQALIVDNLCSGLSSCSYEDIQFSAELDDVYCESVYQGAVNGKEQIAAYAAACPDAKLVLSGYSEGANVVGDILGGGGGSIWGECEETWVDGLVYGESPASQIVGVIVFGDVRHTTSQSYNVLSGAEVQGPAPRNDTMLSALDNYASIMRNYCNAQDPVCADGGDDVSTHLSYISDYAAEAAEWVKSIASLGGETASVSTIVYESAGLKTGLTTKSLETTVGTTTQSGTGSPTGTPTETTAAVAASLTASLTASVTGASSSSGSTNGTISAAITSSASLATSTTTTSAASSAAASTTASANAGSDRHADGLILAMMALAVGVLH